MDEQTTEPTELDKIKARLDVLESVRPLTVQNSLSDVSDVPNARTNLALGTAATTDTEIYVLKSDVQSIVNELRDHVDSTVTDTVAKIDGLYADLHETRSQLTALVNDLHGKVNALPEVNPLAVPAITAPTLSSPQALGDWARETAPIIDTIRMALIHAGIVKEQ